MINKIRQWEANFTLSKAALIVGFFSLASRLTGLIRDRMFASRFGAGDTLDSYYAAFRLPDFVFNLLILGTLSVAFIPVFTEWLIKDKSRAVKITNTILNFSLLTMSAVCLLLFLNAAWVTKLMVPGFSGAKLADTVRLTKIFLLSPVIFTVSNLFGSVLNATKKFLVASFAPILYNAGIIFGIIFLFPRYGLNGLGFGVILGALLHLAVQVIESYKIGFTYMPVMDLKDQAVIKIGKLFFPRIFGLDTSQLSLLIGSIIGSFLTSGSIAILNLANNLQSVPAGIFGVSTAVASFPLLSETYAQKNEKIFSQTLLNSLMQILFFVIPISVLMLIFRAYIVRLVYGSGKFDWQDTILTFQTLGIFCFSLFSQAIIPLLSRAFYARQNTKIPVVVGLGSMAINILASWYFSKTYGVLGIASGFALASLFNCLILFLLLRIRLMQEAINQKIVWDFDSKLTNFLARLLLSSSLSGLTGYLVLNLLAPMLNTHTGLGLLIQAGTAGLVAVLAFLFASHGLGIEQTKKTLKFFDRFLTFLPNRNGKTVTIHKTE